MGNEQKGGYVCSAKCFDNKNWSAEQLQQCVERCQMPMQQVQNYLQQEMQSFQVSFPLCAHGKNTVCWTYR